MTPHEWLSSAVEDANALESRDPVYEVWSVLLGALPEDIHPDEAMGYGRGLANQAIWNQPASLKIALGAKRKNLSRSPFHSTARLAAIEVWDAACAADPPPSGLGRFRKFNLGWNAFNGEGEQLARFLELLREVNDPGLDAEEALELAQDVLDEDMPFKQGPRASECLHLARPDVFPLLNTQHGLAAIAFLGRTDTDSRETYLEVAPQLVESARTLGLRDLDALDVFMVGLNDELCRLEDEPFSALLEAVHEALDAGPVLGTDFEPAPESSSEDKARALQVISRDPAKLERALAAHRRIQIELAERLREGGHRPLSPIADGPDFDLAWIDEAFHLIEVKSLTDANETSQMRCGIGQLFHYREALWAENPELPVALVLATERAPADPLWAAVADSLNITLVYPPDFDGLL